MEEHAGLIVKGKRTKRQRPHSPVPFEVADSFLTPATSSVEVLSSTTEEEEDMANCLILLAQGHGHRRNPDKLHTEVEDRRHCRNDSDCDEAVAIPKLTTRKYLEMTSSSGGRAGYHAFRCKTCNQTFPSFQALGGHRASHKKSAKKKQVFILPPTSPDDEEGQFRKFSPHSLQLCNNNMKNGNSIISNKLHQCSICGAEFASGQALGGHMRSHRAVPVGISIPNAVPSSLGAITTLSLIPPGSDRVKVHSLSWDLDLNLPASAQDHQADYHHHREICQPGEFPSPTNPPSSSSQQQRQQIEQKSRPANKSSMVFSTSPALVKTNPTEVESFNFSQLNYLSLVRNRKPTPMLIADRDQAILSIDHFSFAEHADDQRLFA